MKVNSLLHTRVSILDPVWFLEKNVQLVLTNLRQWCKVVARRCLNCTSCSLSDRFWWYCDGNRGSHGDNQVGPVSPEPSCIPPCTDTEMEEREIVTTLYTRAYPWVCSGARLNSCFLAYLCAVQRRAGYVCTVRCRCIAKARTCANDIVAYVIRKRKADSGGGAVHGKGWKIGEWRSHYWVAAQ